MDQILEVTEGRFDVLNKKPNSWIMYFQIPYAIDTDEYITIIEVDSIGNYTGRQITGQVISKYITPLQFTNQDYLQINLNKMAFPWIDYSATSTVVGWGSFTEKIIKYQVVGNSVIVQFKFAGTSNSTAASFTIPQIAAATPSNQLVLIRFTNNGAASATPGQGLITAGTSTINLFRDGNNTAWAAANAKNITGTIIIQL